MLPEERERRMYEGMHRMRNIRLCDLITDLTAAEFRLLYTIVEHADETRKISELAEMAGMQPAAVSRLMNSLEEKGLIERRSRTGNRRVTDVYPTQRGRESSDRGKQTIHDYWTEVFESIPTGDADRLVEILDEITDSMERVLERRVEQQKEDCP